MTPEFAALREEIHPFPIAPNQLKIGAYRGYPSLEAAHLSMFLAQVTRGLNQQHGHSANGIWEFTLEELAHAGVVSPAIIGQVLNSLCHEGSPWMLWNDGEGGVIAELNPDYALNPFAWPNMRKLVAVEYDIPPLTQASLFLALSIREKAHEHASMLDEHGRPMNALYDGAVIEGTFEWFAESCGLPVPVAKQILQVLSMDESGAWSLEYFVEPGPDVQPNEVGFAIRLHKDYLRSRAELVELGQEAIGKEDQEALDSIG
ncbi:hypothetical protein [Citricoccus nitrophenolicus]|uniref:hypothetical protein n=1 Tax=Citricoccus nitrophenolicus TaxID=863575 RepID=UPI0031EFE111